MIGKALKKGDNAVKRSSEIWWQKKVQSNTGVPRAVINSLVLRWSNAVLRADNKEGIQMVKTDIYTRHVCSVEIWTMKKEDVK